MSLLDPVLELGTVVTWTRIILESAHDLLKFLFGNSLDLFGVTLDVLFSNKRITLLSLLFHNLWLMRFQLESKVRALQNQSWCAFYRIEGARSIECASFYRLSRIAGIPRLRFAFYRLRGTYTLRYEFRWMARKALHGDAGMSIYTEFNRTFNVQVVLLHYGSKEEEGLFWLSEWTSWIINGIYQS